MPWTGAHLISAWTKRMATCHEVAVGNSGLPTKRLFRIAWFHATSEFTWEESVKQRTPPVKKIIGRIHRLTSFNRKPDKALTSWLRHS